MKKEKRKERSSIPAKKDSSLTSDYFMTWVSMSLVRYGIYRLREAEVRPLGISPEQGAVLLMIKGLNNQATPAEIARWLFRKPNTVSVLLKSMERKNLVIRKNDQYARNIIRIALTEHGEQILNKASERKSIIDVMSVLSEADCKHLNECFDKLMKKASDNLGIDHRPPLPNDDWYNQRNLAK